MKSRKPSSKPQVKDEPVDDEHIPSLNRKWPQDASIVYPITGDLKLTHQPGPLAEVIRGAIKVETKYLLCTNAFPSLANRTRLTREWLCAATEDDTQINKIIRTRVKEDSQFVRALQDLVQYIIFSIICVLIVLLL